MGARIRILAVDDDAVACQLLQEVLEQEGYQVSTATCGQEAVDLAREVPFDLAIVDIRIPDISGIEVLKALKRINTQMPVLMTTAYSSMDTAIEAIRQGAYDYLSKPCKIEELSLTVKRALEQYKLLRENQYFRQELRQKYKFENIVGTTPAILEVYKTVGGTEPIPLDVRVIAATNKDLERLVNASRFREDLFYRLNVVTVYLPPLRQRQEDIPLLANHVLRKYSEANHKLIAHLTPEAMELLCSYDWPGNVRELEHGIERAVTLTMNNCLLPEDLPPKLQRPVNPPRLGDSQPLLSLEELEKQHIQAVMRATQGNKKKAAQILGINRRSLYRIAQRYGLDLDRDHAREQL